MQSSSIFYTVLLISATVAFSSCATKYQSVGSDITGGHSFRRLAVDVFEVEFRGNGFTNPKRAKDFALLRSAEVCKEHNFRYFSLIGEGDNSRTDIMKMGSTSHTTGSINTYGGYGTYSGTTTTTTNDIPVHKPRPSVTIKCYTHQPGGHAGPVQEADRVIQELRTKYKIP
jgi:hypothetical protein